MKRLLAIGLACLSGCFALPAPDAFEYATPAEQAAADGLVAADALGDAADGDAAADVGDALADVVDAGEDVTAADALDVQLADAPPEVDAVDGDAQTVDAGTDTAVVDEAAEIVDAVDAADVVLADVGPDIADTVDALADATDASAADAPDLADLADGSDTAGTDATLVDVADADSADLMDTADVVLADDASAVDADAADDVALPDANTNPCAGIVCPVLACKANSCDPSTSQCVAVNLATGATCEDGSLCTSGDQCVAGTCFGGGASNCNDGNACTDDSCAPATGCANVTNNANACSDGNVCTADACVAGVCSSKTIDADGDGYGPSATCGGDCDDGNAAIHPGAAEVCNGVDDNCNGKTDEAGATNCTLFYKDADSDGYGGGTPSCLCAASAIYSTSKGGDCNDNDPTINPARTEVCNGVDDDCNGQIDEGLVTVTYYQDSDFDGYGNAAVSKSACSQPMGYVTVSGDCNDASPTVHPGATEICNGVDDNCNGTVDEGVKLNFYADADGDGYGDTSKLVQACSAPVGDVSDHTDCDDTRATVHPGATEICNGLDDNCNGQTDEGLGTATYYADADADGYGAGTGKAACGPLASYTAMVSGDCNDASAAVNPGHAEVCGNSIDDNCNGLTDEGCAACLNTTNSLATVKAGWKLYNSADYSSTAGPGVRLVPAAASKKGQVYYTTARIAAAKTTIQYDAAFFASPEGMALNIIDVPNLTALESYIANTASGACMGYGSNNTICGSYPVNGVHVKLDTHDSDAGDHGSVVFRV